MVATATDAAVVMLQYEDPIRTGHFLVKRKTTTTDTEDYSILVLFYSKWTPLDSSMKSLFCYHLDAVGLKKPNWLVTRI